jgi:hypothetical protein
MARPQKNNADYFPHDNGMWSDRKIVALRNRFGLTGYAVWNLLLETLCESESFEIAFDDSEVELLANFWGLETAKLKEMITFMERLKLIKIDNGLLWSDKLKERLKPVLDERERKRNWSRKRWQKDGNGEESDGENEVLDVANPSHSEEQSASSILKESKGNKSKEKESKLNESKENRIERISDEILTPSQKARKFLKEIENSNLPDSDERKKFFNYWTEKNKSGTKERWELEKTFEVEKRFATWQINAQKFNNSNYGKNQSNRIRSGHVSTEGHADLVV